MDNIRTYRNWVEDKDLVSFVVAVGESDLFIRARTNLEAQAQRSVRKQRAFIETYIQSDPEFALTLEPYQIKGKAAKIVQDMVEASSLAGVGPMAAVAGAVAEHVGRDLLGYSPEVIVENGGDIFLKTQKTRKIGIYAGKSSLSGKLALEAAAGIWGICTSSGTVGHSLSFGRTDAAVVICHSAIVADAWATRLGNMVKSADDIEKALDFAKQQPTIKGTVFIVGDKIGAWGEVKLVKS
ncbi:MAG: UPF0280 family protein [Candidatus Omnitrophota bacterium]